MTLGFAERSAGRAANMSNGITSGTIRQASWSESIVSSSAQRTEILLPQGLSADIVNSLTSQAPWLLYRVALALNDLITTSIAFWLAYIVRFGWALPIFQLDAPASPNIYLRLSLAMLALWQIIYASVGLYNRRNLLGGTAEYALVFRGATIGLLTVIILEFLFAEMVIARGWLLLAVALSFLLSAVGRFSLRRVVYSLRKRGFFVRPTLVVGSNEEGKLLSEQLLLWKTSGLELAGVVGGSRDDDSRELPVLGSLQQLDELVEQHSIGELVLATSALSREDMLNIFERYGVSDDVNVRLSSGLFEVITTGLDIREIGYVPLVSVNRVRLTGADRVLKLLLDYALAIPGLILVSPLMLLIALAIKLDSPGSVIYRRRVMGLNGREFDAFKFRTMAANGQELLEADPELQAELAEHHKLKDDPRVTRLGAFLRRFSLDELPQLLNVISRDMSLVGPRMISPPEMAKYDHWGINLLTVRPGITGMWQVSGRSEIDYAERVRLDMHYIRNWSIWLDLHLLIQTIPAVLKGRGAY